MGRRDAAAGALSAVWLVISIRLIGSAVSLRLSRGRRERGLDYWDVLALPVLATIMAVVAAAPAMRRVTIRAVPAPPTSSIEAAATINDAVLPSTPARPRNPQRADLPVEIGPPEAHSTCAAALMRPWLSSSAAAMYSRSNFARAAFKVAPLGTFELPFTCSRDTTSSSAMVRGGPAA